MSECRHIVICTCGAKNRVSPDRCTPRCARCKQPLPTSDDRVSYIYVITERSRPIELTEGSTEVDRAYYVGVLLLLANDAARTDAWDEAKYSGIYETPTGDLDFLVGRAVLQFGAEILNRTKYRLEVRQIRGAAANTDVLLVRGIVADEVDALNAQLYELLLEAYEWGSRNGHPRMRDYPQYEEVRKIGGLLHELFGLAGMQAACRVARAKASAKYSHLGGFTALAEYAWDGIGDWQH